MAWLALPFLFSAFLGFSQAGNEIVRKAEEGFNPPPYRKSGEWLVSVIIPTKNEECYLPACLECLRNQTYEPTETIVVDYLSRDATPEIARSYNVKLIETNISGIGPARDLGVQSSNGEILIFLDADCIFEPTFIEQIVEALQDSHIVTWQYAVFEGDAFLQGIFAIHNFTKSPTTVEGFSIATWRSIYNAVGPFKLETGEHIYWRTKAALKGFKFEKLNHVGFAVSARRFYGYGRAKPTTRWCIERILHEEGYHHR